jgi:hypothetical protein
MFTLVEGEWDEVMDVLKRAVNAVAARSPRVSLVMEGGHPSRRHRCPDQQSDHSGQIPGPTAGVAYVIAQIAFRGG